MKLKSLLGLIAGAAIILSSCQKADEELASLKSVTSYDGYDVLVDEPTPELCYSETRDFLGLGKVTIGNDATHLYVIVDITAENAALARAAFNVWAEGTQPADLENAYNYYPFQANLGEGSTSRKAILKIPYNQAWGVCMTTNLKIRVVDGQGGFVEFAWLTNDNKVTSRDYLIKYCWGSCGECYQDDTAWAFGKRYNTKGNWATYVDYYNAAKTVTLFAGQTYDAGTVSFSAPVDGKVTITVTLANGFEMVPGSELVVQDYATAPSGNPAPGLFAHKTYELTITVPANNFYGVHINVRKEVPCE